MNFDRFFGHAPAMALAVLTLAAADANAATRQYSICAVEKEWDYTAGNATTNHMTGVAYTDEEKVFVGDPSPINIGRVYTKARYVSCDANGNELPRAEKDKHLGILGPVIRAEVGDTIVVKFRNKTRFPASMHPHGVFYDKNSEGAPYAAPGDNGFDDMVAANGGTHTYTWGVPRRAGPGPRDPSSIAWLYHSHSDEVGDTNAGLVGAIIVTRAGEAKPDGSPRGVDKEFVSLFTVMDENASIYLDANMETKLLPGGPAAEDLKADEGFIESNLKHAVNGLLYGMNHDYQMKVGDKVRWYVLSLGTEVDIHTPHWHGVTLLHAGQRTDVAEVFPGSSKVFSLRADNPGHWMFHCHVNDHIIAGMHAMFTILPGARNLDESDWE
jgi:manganese oxidase